MIKLYLARWQMPVTPALMKLRVEDHKLQIMASQFVYPFSRHVGWLGHDEQGYYLYLHVVLCKLRLEFSQNKCPGGEILDHLVRWALKQPPNFLQGGWTILRHYQPHGRMLLTLKAMLLCYDPSTAAPAIIYLITAYLLPRCLPSTKKTNRN